MQNPVAIMRQQQNKDAGITQEQSSKLQEEIEAEQKLEKQRTLWLQHPCTIALKKTLEAIIERDLDLILFRKPMPESEIRDRLGALTGIKSILKNELN